MKLALIQAIKLLVRNLLTKAMVFWALGLYVKYTETKLDDKGLALIKALDKGDAETIQAAMREFGEEAAEAYKRSKLKESESKLKEAENKVS